MFDQEATHGKRDPVALIGGNLPGPERLGDDAEHGTPIQTLSAALQQVAAEVSESECFR
jgi:hypothetical protein